MDAVKVAMLRELLAQTGWVERVGAFARALRTSVRYPGDLLLVGTPEEEPWHLAAHLDDESRFHDLPALVPTLVRWSPPAAAPPHLRVGIDRIESASRGETLFVVTPQAAPVPLLERLADARNVGATVLALDTGDRDLEGLAHEAITVPRSEPAVSFDGVQHLVSTAAGEPFGHSPGLRGRLARLLHTLSGEPA